MALKSSREGLRKELVDYLGNIIIDDNLRNEIIKVVGDTFVTSESLNEAVNNFIIEKEYLELSKKRFEQMFSKKEKQWQ